MSKRYIIVGDVHGCLQELDEMIKLVEFRPGQDDVILAGDLVDRGPDSAGVVKRAKELKFRAVKGNHDHKHVRWRNWEAKVASGQADKNPMTFSEDYRAIHSSLREEDLDWMEALPRIIRLDGARVVVHGGLVPNKPIERQPKEVTMVRYVHAKKGHFVGIRSIGDIPEGTVYWSEVWPGPETVFYGHAVHSLEGPRVDRHDGYECWGLDTGCCFGGRLTAAVLSEDHFNVEVVQVQAKKAYAQIKPARE